ncbi:hypothetical protein Mal15_29970 [Stieleria maiorica]|uniref:Uncharacterized protein n=1 Tax=Stieleria maiorica TaxID=2795974 RepID=A0A5B9MEJ9_9BACT|nr:hypothetical protein [Stieleria maiorica]QEF98939.1 hypothetical protein Mal15_29970 [Stieleria maiorica]
MYPATIRTVHGVILPMAQFTYAIRYCRERQAERVKTRKCSSGAGEVGAGLRWRSDSQ